MITPAEFEVIMDNSRCAVCGTVHEPPYQGGVLSQKMAGSCYGQEGEFIQTQTVCSICLENLQTLADMYKEHERMADVEPDVGQMMRRKEP